MQNQNGEKLSIDDILKGYPECSSGCGRKVTRIMEVFSHDEFYNGSQFEGRCGFHTRFDYNDSTIRARLVSDHWEIVSN